MKLDKALQELDLLAETVEQNNIKDVRLLINDVIYKYFDDLKPNLKIKDLNFSPNDWRWLSLEIINILEKNGYPMRKQTTEEEETI